MTLVKICGITNLEDAKSALASGADQLGFNFYSGSSRYVSPEKARETVDLLPVGPEYIGVFVNEPIDIMLEKAKFVGLDGVQLHGDEDMAYVAEVRKRTNLFVVKAFRVTPSFKVGDALDWPIDFPLFDTYSSRNYGGTGESFDWKEFGSDIVLWFPDTAYIAGGLNSSNVADAVRIMWPYAVDVASGVESSPGKKDPKKLEAFIRNAKNAC